MRKRLTTPSPIPQDAPPLDEGWLDLDREAMVEVTSALVFEETETERTQEFVLRRSADGGRSFREIVRQQWNFSPPNSIREVEEYRIELSGVSVLELVIVPDISRGSARASLKSLRLS